MAILKIHTYPDPVLRLKAEQVTSFDKDLESLSIDMAATMYDAPGVGLAANQVGVLKQIVVVDISVEEAERRYITLVNPVISNGEGSVIGEEGCLSAPECMGNVKRFQKIHVIGQRIDGSALEFDAEDRFARIIQHEVDHLYGRLFIDYLSLLKRTMYKKKVKKMLKEQLA
jgi:peptide deformylase